MTTVIDQKTYLQKYLTGRSGDKKKKKKKPIKGKGFKIIDDDLDLSKMRALDGDELDILNEGEDAPQIVGIIDERPEEMKLEDFKTSSKWRVINQDDGFNSKLKVEEVKRNNKEVKKENEIVFGKMYSDSEDEKNNSDPSLPRKNSQNQAKNKSKKHSSDSDFSPPRRKDSKRNDNASRNNDSDVSPQRKDRKRYDSDASPPRKSTKSRNYDSDASPPRMRDKKYDSNKKSNKHDSDTSPLRKTRKSRNNNSDESPPRKKKNYESQSSPPNKHASNVKRKKPSRWGDADENQLYQSRPSKSPEMLHKSRNRSPDRRNKDKNKHTSRDSDLSPPRKSAKPNSEDSDIPPPRKRKLGIEKDRRKETKSSKYNSDSDLSPPRRERYNGIDKNGPPKKMGKTLDGKKAGLQDARQLKDENKAFRRKEEEVYRNMTDELSGRNAKAVSRKSKRATSEDKQKQREKSKKQKELDEKYKIWSKGIKQIEDQQAAVQDFIHEASKPLARYKDDQDLEDKLRDVERDGDPMLRYMRERKRERGELGPEKPQYKGNFPPNRFNIRPGYRWDGVDRSNGYEKKYFEHQSKRKAQEEEAYKWSIEDL